MNSIQSGVRYERKIVNILKDQDPDLNIQRIPLSGNKSPIQCDLLIQSHKSSYIEIKARRKNPIKKLTKALTKHNNALVINNYDNNQLIATNDVNNFLKWIHRTNTIKQEISYSLKCNTPFSYITPCQDNALIICIKGITSHKPMEIVYFYPNAL